LWDKWRGILALDPKHPDVQAWLRETFRALREMGWRFFKIDFLYAAALPAAYHDRSLSRAGALRAGLQAIRDGIGDDAFLLGCGCPLGPAVGLVDAMRIGADVTPRWANPMRWAFRDHHCLSTRHSLRNTIQRAFLQRAWWLNDPDCLLVRQNNNKMNLHEIRTLASIDALSGGMLLVSDDMTQLAAERLEILRKALAIRTPNMQVLDPDIGEFPGRLLARSDDGYYLLIVNWHDQEDSPPIFDLKEVMPLLELARVAELRDVWSNQLIHQHDGLINLGTIPAHGCRLVQIRVRQE
jgi:alpha-galactosidase